MTPVTDDRQRLARAYAAARAGRFDEAERALKGLAETSPSLGPGLHLRAIVRHRLGRLELAMADMVRALALLPRDPAVLLDAGNLADDLGDPEGALTHYRAAWALRPEIGLPLRNAAAVLRRLKRFREARDVLEQVLRLDAGDVVALHALGGVLLDLGDARDAAVMLDRALAMAPADPAMLRDRARAEAECGRPSLALYDRACGAAPDDPACAVGRAIALFEKDDAEAAITALIMAVDRFPGIIEPHRVLAELRWQLGQSNDFDRALRDDLTAHPRAIGLWQLHLQLLARAEQYERLLARARDARSALGEQAFIAPFAALAASRLGDLPLADMLFEATDPDGPVDVRVARLQHLLRAQRPEQVALFVDRHGGLRAPRAEIPYATLAWRLVGDARATFLEAQQGLIRHMPLAIDAADRVAVRDLLDTLHRARNAPIAQSIRGGTQSEGNFFRIDNDAVRRLGDACSTAVHAYAEGLKSLPEAHPLAALDPDGLHYAGSWSVKLKGGGFHVPHCHPHGAISSALHIDVPAFEGTAGHLEFGRPPAHLGLDLGPFEAVRPVPWHLALFPSTMWHGTVPFAAGDRWTIAFDMA